MLVDQRLKPSYSRTQDCLITEKPGEPRRFKSEVHQPGSEPLPAFTTVAIAKNTVSLSSERLCSLLWV
jgi:hypothetical protein